MGRDTSIYMFDRAKTSTTLHNDLLNKVYSTETFKKFIEDRKKKFNEDYISFDNILETLRKDANLLTPQDLFEITLFLSHQAYTNSKQEDWSIVMEQIENLYHHYGIIKLFELPSKTVCTAYMFQYGNYTHYFPLDEIKSEDGGTNILSEDFLRFNDYVILVMQRILERKLDGYDYELTEEEKNIIDIIKNENKDNALLTEVIENELNFLIEMSATDNDGPYSHTIYHAYNFLSISIEMKSRIDVQKNPRIVIIDSY